MTRLMFVLSKRMVPSQLCAITSAALMLPPEVLQEG
jgi:hypothetical protein